MLICWSWMLACWPSATARRGMRNGSQELHSGLTPRVGSCLRVTRSSLFLRCRRDTRKCPSRSSCMGATTLRRAMCSSTSSGLVRLWRHPPFHLDSQTILQSDLTLVFPRLAPEYMLCLQNGRFDNADRMFNRFDKTPHHFEHFLIIYVQYAWFKILDITKMQKYKA